VKVIFIQPNWIDSKRVKDIKSLHSVTPPLGLLYLAACARRDGHKVMLIDALAEQLTSEEVAGKVIKNRPDVIALTGTTPQISFAFDVMNKVKARPEGRGIKTVLGGPHATAVPLETMGKCDSIDFLVYGEGERTFTELLATLKKKKNSVSILRSVKGIYLPAKKGPLFSGPRPFIEDLDVLPYPEREIITNWSGYHMAPSDTKRSPSTTMITSRGCPYGCKYCNRAVFGRVYRCMSSGYVLGEIRHLIKRYKIREIKFWDDVFTIDRKRTIEICDGIIKEKLDIVWSCETRVDLVDLEMLRKMRQAGCWQIDYGVESGNQELVDKINKGIKLEQVRKAVRLTRQAGISTRGYFIVGLPGETIETARKSIDFAIEAGLDYATFFMCVPYPGTELYELAKKEGGIRSDDWRKYSHIDFDNLIYVPPSIKDTELKGLIGESYRKFYLRPAYIFREALKIRGMEDIIKKAKGALAILGGF
jgi:anaerobic magnesium-protoporphyrin IX monomethyl ester cyclase